MKNILGKLEDLRLYNARGVLVYKFYKDYDSYWCERTYDDKGSRLTYKKSTGYWWEYTKDDKGNPLTYKGSDGYWYEKTYDNQGNELTFKDSDGVSRGFNIPEYTMKELTKIVGKEFKIKK